MASSARICERPCKAMLMIPFCVMYSNLCLVPSLKGRTRNGPKAKTCPKSSPEAGPSRTWSSEYRAFRSNRLRALRDFCLPACASARGPSQDGWSFRLLGCYATNGWSFRLLGCYVTNNGWRRGNHASTHCTCPRQVSKEAVRALC